MGLRLADRMSRKAIAYRTTWTVARVRQIELKPFVRASTVRLYLCALDGAVRFRDAASRKTARQEVGVLSTKRA
jgi:hypothetical protein